MAVTVIHRKIFRAVVIPPNGNAIAAKAVDLTGCSDYRLLLLLQGDPNSTVILNELSSHAGSIQQVNTDIDTFQLDNLGTLVVRRKYDVVGPVGVFLRLFNTGAAPLTVNGSLYSLRVD